MAVKKVGELIKEARTGAGMTQEQLAKKVKGITAADISKAERGEISLTNDQLKTIAKATGVTQKSLLDAPKPKMSSNAKTSGNKKTASSSDKTSINVTAEEKKLIQLYRKADTDQRKAALALLKKNDTEEIGGILGSLINNPDIKDAISGLQGLL